jgi:hypothetical protein
MYRRLDGDSYTFEHPCVNQLLRGLVGGFVKVYNMVGWQVSCQSPYNTTA